MGNLSKFRVLFICCIKEGDTNDITSCFSGSLFYQTCSELAYFKPPGLVKQKKKAEGGKPV